MGTEGVSGWVDEWLDWLSGYYLSGHVPKKQQLESIVEHEEGRKQGRKEERVSLEPNKSIYVSIGKLLLLLFLLLLQHLGITSLLYLYIEGMSLEFCGGGEGKEKGKGGEEGERGGWLAFSMW